MKHKFVMPLEIRSPSSLTKTPEYIIKGKINANIPDTFKRIKNREGEIIEIKQSVFTDKCLESMRRQAKTKKIYADIEHKTSSSFNINHFLNEAKVDQTLKDAINSQLEISDMPLLKLKDLTKDTNGDLIADIRMNPNYRNIDDKHKNYFDSVWGSLKDGFIDGVSFTFVATEVKEENGIMIIDDTELFGIELTGGASLPENQIFEVAQRATQELVQQRAEGGEKMNEELKKKEEELKTKEAEINEKIEKFKKVEEDKQTEAVEKDKLTQKETMEQMQTRLAELEKTKPIEGDPDGGKKGVVKQEPNPNAPPDTPQPDSLQEQSKLQQEIREAFNKNIQLKNPYPNNGYIFGERPIETNPQGEITLGQVLMLQREDPKYFEAVMEQLSPAARSALTDDKSFANIPKSERIIGS